MAQLRTITGGSRPAPAALLHSALLSGVAGYVDAAGFVLLFGVFPAHMTGELVGDAIALSDGHLAARASRLWVFPAFVVSIAVAALVARVLRSRGRKAVVGLLTLVTASLALFSLSGLFAYVLRQSHLPPLLSGGCAVAAMGFQTALMRESLTGCQTTVMTGNLTQVILEIVDHVCNRIGGASALGAPPRSRLSVVGSALGAFAICSVLGAWLARRVGASSIALPTLVTAGLTLCAWREERAQPFAVSEAPEASGLWFTDDEFWPDSDAPRALSQPYTEPSSATRIKAERVVAVEDEPTAKQNKSAKRG
ncbi:MAG TPA: YoaK family protein [Polyangiaceae bacterium]